MIFMPSWATTVRNGAGLAYSPVAVKQVGTSCGAKLKRTFLMLKIKVAGSEHSRMISSRLPMYCAAMMQKEISAPSISALTSSAIC